ncbi:hypothetical protein ACFLQ2_04790 [archaeon]
MAEQLIRELEGAGYKCFVPLEKKSCFDVAARNGDRFLLLKVFTNIDSLREPQAQNLKALAASLGATPIVIGEKSKAYELKTGLVYDRYGVTVVSIETFTQLLRGYLPKKRFYKGRVVAEIDATKLEQASPTELAKELHVTREAIYSYRHGTRVEFEKALEMERILDEPLIKEINPFSVPTKQSPMLTGYLQKMHTLGFDVVPVHRGFDALAKEKESLLVDSERSEAYAKRKAKFVAKAADFFESHPVIVMESRRSTIKGVPVLREKEIAEAESAEGLTDLVKKRKKQ